MKNRIHIVRPYNLLIVAATMIVLLAKYRDETIEDYWIKAVFLILPAVLTAAAGYIVNDIFDIKTDAVNRPNRLIVIDDSATETNYVKGGISKKKAWMLYAIINLISVLISFGFSQQYLIINLCIIAILYLYSYQLKGTPLIGNLVVALCSSAVLACSILLARPEVDIALLNFTGYIVFSFFISLIRELVKDMQDIEGDKAASFKTYPILMGIKGAKILVYVLCGVEIIFCGIYSFLAWGLHYYVSSIIMGIITAALIYFLNFLSKSKTKEEFRASSQFLKYIMFVGVLNIPFS